MNVPEKHRAIALAWVDGAEIEGRKAKATYRGLTEWVICSCPSWEADWEYRIRPTKPSINWEHVAPEYVALATDSYDNSFIYTRIPKTAANAWTATYPCRSAEAFQSFVKGTCDWKDSLVVRPSADSEKGAETAAPLPTTAHATPKLEWSKTLFSGKRMTFEDALRIARGCTDYGGGHSGNAEHYEIYQHGIQTVINALTTASETELDDTQTRALHSMGANIEIHGR